MKALTRNLVVIFLSTLLLTAVVSAQEIAVIETKFGKIEIQFFEDKAPGHVKNFKDLARKGFYNGTIFHRVIPGHLSESQQSCPQHPYQRSLSQRRCIGHRENPNLLPPQKIVIRRYPGPVNAP